MNINKEKVKEFVKEHKYEIAIGALAIVMGGVTYKIATAKPASIKAAEKSAEKWTYLDVPELAFGRIDQLTTNGRWMDAIVNDITVNDLGDFGKELLKIDGIKPETGVSALISMSDEWVREP